MKYENRFEFLLLLHFILVSSILFPMIAKQEALQKNPLDTIRSFESMMELIKQFPVKGMRIKTELDKWELSSKYPQVGSKK